MEKGKRLKYNNGEDLLPEVIIQHIQSFLTGKEAAQTTLLSKYWYKAWLARPTVDLDQRNFQNYHDQSLGFAEFAMKTMQRYLDLKLKIDNFRLHTISSERDNNLLVNRLIVMAMKLGATHLNLELWPNKFVLPQKVLGSETLVRLHASGRNIYGNVKWRSLKFLVLSNVRLRDSDMLRDIVSSCKLLEELSILNCTGGRRYNVLDLSGMNSNEHHRLRRLLLEKVYMNALFFSDFASRFPCLKDLSVACFCCVGEIQIVSTSLQCVSFADPEVMTHMTMELDVPNLVHFRYSGVFIPSLRIKSSRECKTDISICYRYPMVTRQWCLQLKNLLTQLMAYKISLSICVSLWEQGDYAEGDIGFDSRPLVLDNLTLHPIFPPYDMAYKLLTSLFRFCRPNFLTVYWLPRQFIWSKDDSLANILCKKFMNKMVGPNSGIPDQSVFGQVGLKTVMVQVYEEILAKWQPLCYPPLRALLTAPQNKRKFCFLLKWGSGI